MHNIEGHVPLQWDTYQAPSWPSSGSGHLQWHWMPKQLWRCLLWLPEHTEKDVTERHHLLQHLPEDRHYSSCWGYSSEHERGDSHSHEADALVQEQADLNRPTNEDTLGVQWWEVLRSRQRAPRRAALTVTFTLTSEWHEAAGHEKIGGRGVRGWGWW